MRAWFVALAAAIWVIVVSAGFLLFAGFGYCIIAGDRTSLACSTVSKSGYFDVITLFVGVPALVFIDYAVRNPSWFDKPLTTRVTSLWMTLTLVLVLLATFALLPTGLLPFLLALWVVIGLTLATIFIARAVIPRPVQKNSQSMYLARTPRFQR
jgi:hypothetical protein